MWACLHEYVLYSYGLHMLVSVGGDCGHVPACSLLWKEGAPQASYHLYHLTRTESNPTQMKLVGQTSHASLTGRRKQPLLTIMLKRFKSADLGALTQHRMAADVWAKPHSARESHLKGENPVDQQNREASPSVCQSTFLPRTFRNQTDGAAGRDTSSGHELKLG